MEYGRQYLLTILSGFLIALLLTPLGGWLGRRWGITATPGGRRKHHGIVSRLGGIGLALGFFGALGVSSFFPIPTSDQNEGLRLYGLLIGGGMMFVLGLIDDRYDLPFWVQYGGYFIASLIAIFALIILQQFNNPFTGTLVELSWVLYVPLTVFWMTGMTVTVNWLDGLDGLAAGVAVVLCATLSVHMYRVGQYSVIPQALALLGASLGFLVYNVSPARVFLGSNGAFFLGYLMGVLGLIGGGRVATVLLVMGIPIVDVAWTILDRVSHGKSPFKGDRRHLHFRLQDAGVSTRAIVLIYWVFCAFFGTMALILPSGLYKLLALGLLGILTLALLLYLSRDKIA